ncbi:COX assembly mitochondrial protein homolog isoform X2 [Varanus komodoensis]|uniref:COX assembly mitochondrial protein homolog isoform X2 n=1 Tax=Varanus komodoensis TaxID=61221 RepID=UPI001CF7A23F|nr:COX assembly mitochondrial protein homolog isoform X2 [Varanus komodoensis]
MEPSLGSAEEQTLRHVEKDVLIPKLMREKAKELCSDKVQGVVTKGGEREGSSGVMASKMMVLLLIRGKQAVFQGISQIHAQLANTATVGEAFGDFLSAEKHQHSALPRKYFTKHFITKRQQGMCELLMQPLLMLQRYTCVVHRRDISYHVRKENQSFHHMVLTICKHYTKNYFKKYSLVPS